MPDVIALARDFPETKIVINHVGGPLGTGTYAERLPDVFETWKSNLRELAKCPNVFVKLGGMGMRQTAVQFNRNPMPPTSPAARRYLAAVCRDLHRGLRCRPGHVREQLPRRQALHQLSGAVERVQAPGCGLFDGGEDGAVFPARPRASTASNGPRDGQRFRRVHGQTNKKNGRNNHEYRPYGAGACDEPRPSPAELPRRRRSRSRILTSRWAAGPSATWRCPLTAANGNFEKQGLHVKVENFNRGGPQALQAVMGRLDRHGGRLLRPYDPDAAGRTRACAVSVLLEQARRRFHVDPQRPRQ